MIYLVREAFNYEQLIKVNRDIAQFIEEGITNILQNQYVEMGTGKDGIVIYDLGNEKAVNPARIADSFFKVYKLLDEQRGILFGFNVLLLILDTKQDKDVEPEIRRILLSINEEDSIWVNRNAQLFLNDFFYFEKKSGLCRISGQKHRVKKFKSSPPYILPQAVEKVLDILFGRLNGDQNIPGLILSGPPEKGIKETVREVVRRIYMNNSDIHPIRAFTLFRRQSPIHPFLNSIDAGFLEKVPLYLKQTEAVVWESKFPFLDYLLNTTSDSKCPDRLFQDFYAAYNIYISAYIRMLQKRLLPALFICEDLETYNKASLELLRTILVDFTKIDSFFPILIVPEIEALDRIGELNFKSIHMDPAGWKDVQKFSHCFFPGIVLPKSIARVIATNVEGKILPIKQYLFLLESEGKIIKENKGYRWISQKEKKINLPENDISVLWRLLKTLDSSSIDILYTVCLSGGLINKFDLYRFVEFTGTPHEETEKVLQNLANLGFINNYNPVTACSGYTRKKCEILLGLRCSAIQNNFLKFMIQQWREKRYRRLILLFHFFIKNGREDLSLEILPEVLKQKLDERDLKGVKPFLKIQSRFFGSSLENKLSVKFDAVLNAARLRYFMISGNSKSARELSEKILKSLPECNSISEKGRLLLQLSSYYRTVGDISQSIKIIKRSLLDLHNRGNQKDETSAYIELSSAMLADGKIDDALEYLKFADRLLPRSSYERLRCLSLTAISHFLKGATTKALSVLHDGLANADKIGRREWQLFLTFFKGRIYFYLGNYQQAMEIFLDCLTLIRIYSFPKAKETVSAWLARSTVYNGSPTEGLRMLENIIKKSESVIFLAEAFHFLKDNTNALLLLDRVFQIPKHQTLYPGENIVWHDGFSSIEGRCLTLENKESLLQKYARNFKTYVLAKERRDNPIDLQKIAFQRNVVELDASNSLYFFFYFTALSTNIEDSSVDRITILNKALKYLQERASCIDSPREKYLYLHDNVWNRMIMDEARTNRLI
jgi:tetratricopeptide (TPR) repeat protein